MDSKKNIVDMNCRHKEVVKCQEDTKEKLVLCEKCGTVFSIKKFSSIGETEHFDAVHQLRMLLGKDDFLHKVLHQFNVHTINIIYNAYVLDRVMSKGKKSYVGSVELNG